MQKRLISVQHVPPPAKPIKTQISIKRQHAQLTRLKGIFVPGNKHTANLPGTKRIVHPKKTPNKYKWRCLTNLKIDLP